MLEGKGLETLEGASLNFYLAEFRLESDPICKKQRPEFNSGLIQAIQSLPTTPPPYSHFLPHLRKHNTLKQLESWSLSWLGPLGQVPGGPGVNVPICLLCLIEHLTR